MDKLIPFDHQLIFDSISKAILAIDTKGKIIYLNKTAEKMLNLSRGEALDHYVTVVLPSVGGKLLDCLNSGQVCCGEKIKEKNITLVSYINPILTEDKISGVVGVFQEFSEIANILQELEPFKDWKKWLDTVIDSSYDGLWICDHQGNVLRINKASERISGIKAEQVVGKNVKDLVADGLFDRPVTLEVIKRKVGVTIIQRIRGGKRVLSTGNPVFDEMGEVAFVVTNVRDITDLDHLRNELHETDALAKRYISKLSEMEIITLESARIIFQSDLMQRILEMALRIARYDSTVLISGESGVGKGLVAKIIHNHSDRRDGPFIRIDCAGIPESLVESELFGYERGAFTGAKPEGKPGFFEMANRGTLFLDEIGEISYGLQSKLLRFLEEHEIIRVGGTEPKKIDVRVIAATNKNIEEMVKLKQFRKDFYYRLNIVPIYVPPLRERREDILPIVFNCLKKFNERYCKQKTISPEAVDILCKYDFPGNVRELLNLMERLTVVTERDQIETADLPKALVAPMNSDLLYLSAGDDLPLKQALRKFEELIIGRAIKRYGSQRKAAKFLRVNQATLSRKSRGYCLSAHIDAILHQ